MARRRRQLTDDERAELRSKERELMDKAARSLLTSEGWQRWVRIRALFRQYSAANTWLIAMQMPDATRVAGFRTWLKLNRCVRKGERAIRIWAPMTVKLRDDEGEVKKDEQTGQELKRVRFRLAPVFDVSQTEPLPGVEEVPLLPPSAPVTGDSHAALIPRLIAFAESLGCPGRLRGARRQRRRLLPHRREAHRLGGGPPGERHGAGADSRAGAHARRSAGHRGVPLRA
jgi:hypothetical protein